MKQNELDEMQVVKKHRIAQQTLMMLCYLLLLDVGLYGFGVRWLPYPVNIMVLVMASLFVYMIRIIAAGALVGPSPAGKPGARIVLTTVAAIVLAAAAVLVLTHRGGMEIESDSVGALVLFVTSAVFLVVTLVMMFVRGRADRE